MPSVSKDQQAAMAIALKHPSKLKGRNRGLLKMTKAQLRHFAATKTKELPNKVSQKAAKKCSSCKK